MNKIKLNPEQNNLLTLFYACIVSENIDDILRSCLHFFNTLPDTKTPELPENSTYILASKIEHALEELTKLDIIKRKKQ